MRANRLASTARRLEAAEATLQVLLDALPLSQDGKPRDRRKILRSCETGSYLSAIPYTINGSTLGELEFQDSIRMRAALAPLNLPETCDGCGEPFTLNHAQKCKNGGNIIAL